MRKFITFITTFIMMTTILSGCGQSTSSSQTVESETSNTLKQVTVTYVQSPLNVPSIIEKEKGIFNKNFEELGITTTYSNLTTGPEQTQALASGDIQFLNAVGATSVILSASNGADIKILSMYSRSPKAFMIFSKDNSIKEANDLKGKTIAGPKGTILHEILVAYLTNAGLSEADVNFVNMGIPEAQAALTGGSADVALLAGPAAYNMQKDGYHVITTGEGLTDASIVTATSQQFYEEHPELVKIFLQSQKEVLESMKSNEKETIALTAKATELSDEAVKEMYPLYDFTMEISDDDIAAMQKTEKFMKDTGMIEQDVNIKDLILTP